MMGRSAWPSIIMMALLLSSYEAAPVAAQAPDSLDVDAELRACGSRQRPYPTRRRRRTRAAGQVPRRAGDEGEFPAAGEGPGRDGDPPLDLAEAVGLAVRDERRLPVAADGGLADPDGELTAAGADGLAEAPGASRPSRMARGLDVDGRRRGAGRAAGDPAGAGRQPGARGPAAGSPLGADPDRPGGRPEPAGRFDAAGRRTLR